MAMASELKAALANARADLGLQSTCIIECPEDIVVDALKFIKDAKLTQECESMSSTKEKIALILNSNAL